MTPEELVSRGGIYFDKIQNGMAEYEWESTFLSPRMADKYLRELWKKKLSPIFMWISVDNNGKGWIIKFWLP